MLEKQIKEINKIFDEEARALRRIRLVLLLFCVLGHFFVGSITFVAASAHSPWTIIMCGAWALLVVKTIRLWNVKI